jgi:hypothetical protein
MAIKSKGKSKSKRGKKRIKSKSKSRRRNHVHLQKATTEYIGVFSVKTPRILTNLDLSVCTI